MDNLSTDSSGLRRAAQYLKQGAVVVVPTDTAYGLAALPQIKSALNHIFAIKDRPRTKTIPWVAASLSQVEKFFSLSVRERKLAKAFWPGPLSIVLTNKRSQERIAIRVPDQKIARSLCRRVGRPLTATSANISGQPECYTAASVTKQFAGRVKVPRAIVNAGTLRKKHPSTIIELRPGGIIIHRTGPITKQALLAYV